MQFDIIVLMKFRMAMNVFVVFSACFVIYLMYSLGNQVDLLHRKNQMLKNKETALRERLKIQSKTTEVVCGHNGQQGIPIDIDCGESFVPRYATCICTTMCLADYSLVYNNLKPKDCPRWSKFEITPNNKEEESDEEN